MVGLVLVSYTSTIGAGGMTLLLPNQWSMLDKMYTIPDTVEDYTGYQLDLDPIGWKGTWEAYGKATVRNVQLPFGYNHLTAPTSRRSPTMRRLGPGSTPTTRAGQIRTRRSIGYAVFWAADVWHGVKKHWALEAQRLIRARRATLGPSLTAG